LPPFSRHDRPQKCIPRIICCIATASGDSLGLSVLAPLAADESGNILKLVFMAICATRGSAACKIWPVSPKRVAMRTGLKMQAWAIMSAASSGLRVGTLLYRPVGAIMGVRTSGMLMVVKVTP